jgi:hypothetical protein
MKQFITNHKKAINFILFTLLLPLFTYFFPYTTKPKLKFYVDEPFILGRTNKELDSLSIIYRGKNLQKDSTNVCVTTIIIQNKSSREIKASDYSPESFGIKLIGPCKIVKVTSSDSKIYPLNKYIKPKLLDSCTVELDKVGFDCEDATSIDLYILYKWENRPKDSSFVATGKVIGAEPFQVLHIGEDYSEWLEFLKFMGIFLPIEILVLLPIVFSINYLQKKHRKKQILKKFNPNNIKELNIQQEEMINIYTSLGKKDFILLIKGISKGQDYVNEEKKFIDAYAKVNEKRKRKILFIFSRELIYFSPFALSYKQLLTCGLLIEEKNHFIITQELKNEIERLLEIFSR